MTDLLTDTKAVVKDNIGVSIYIYQHNHHQEERRVTFKQNIHNETKKKQTLPLPIET